MIVRVFNFCRFTALLLVGLAFSAAPAAAGGCGYGCYAPPPVVVQPIYQACSCCGCGVSSYYAYYAAYAYPSIGYAPRVYAPRFYAPRMRVAYPRYFGPRRLLRVRY